MMVRFRRGGSEFESKAYQLSAHLFGHDEVWKSLEYDLHRQSSVVHCIGKGRLRLASRVGRSTLRSASGTVSHTATSACGVRFGSVTETERQFDVGDEGEKTILV